MESRHYGTRSLFVGLGAFSVLLGSVVPADATSVTNKPRKVCVAKNGSYTRPIPTHGHCRPWEVLIKFDELVRGPRGYTGPRGPQGIAGPEGEQGIAGPRGERGEDGSVEVTYRSDTYTVTAVAGTPTPPTQTFRGHCDPGEAVVSGGYSVAKGQGGELPNGPFVMESYPDNAVDDWVVTIVNPPVDSLYDLTVWATCTPESDEA